MKLKIFSIIAVLTMTSSAFAWKETGAGDEVGVEFKSSLINAMTYLKANPISGANVEELLKTAKRASIVVSDKALKVKFRDLVQESVATNQPDTGLITVNRARWNEIKDPRVKEAIALHEVLSLQGKERTGFYQISGTYLSKFGVSPWAVSGLGKGFRMHLVAKTLSCEIGYYSDTATAPEMVKLEAKLKAEDDGDLQVQEIRTTSDGRFKVYMFGVQPKANALNVTAYEYTGISIEDQKTNASTVAGSFHNGMPSQDEDHAQISYTYGAKTERLGNIIVECQLK